MKSPLVMEAEKETSPIQNAVQLKREMGLFSAINMILSVMIGSGIFVSSAAALEYSGSVGMCIVIWIVCGGISLLGALAFAELGTVIPRSGAEYAYFIDSFGPLHKFWGHLPAFLFSWMMILVIRPAEVAIIVLTFSKYFSQPLMELLCIQNEQFFTIVALLALCIITFINLMSVKLYVRVQNTFGFLKVFACLIVICGGVYELFFKGNTQNLHKGFEGTKLDANNIALAFYNGLWAYDGWCAVTIVTEEIKKPEVNILRSIAISVPIVTFLYVFMNIAYMTVMTIPEMVSSPAIAVTFGDRILGSMSFVISLGVALSTFGCALSIQFGVSRLCYASAQDGLMIKSLSYVHYFRMTPVPAVALQGIISFVFVLNGDIIALIEFASFLIWFFYGIAMVSLLVLRKTMKDAHRPYKVPICIPIFIIFVALFLSLTPIISEPSPKYLFAFGWMLLGVIVYYYVIYKKHVPKKFLRKVTYLTQVLFEVLPQIGRAHV